MCNFTFVKLRFYFTVIDALQIKFAGFYYTK